MKYLIVILLSLTMLVFGLILGSRISDSPKEVPSVYKPTPLKTLNIYKIYDLINNYRYKNELKKLVFDPSMCDFAKTRLKQIHDDFSHDGFMPDVKSAFKYTYAGENLARGSRSEERLIDGWINSDSHYENIMNPQYTRTCIASDGYGNDTYAVQIFASY